MPFHTYNGQDYHFGWTNDPASVARIMQALTDAEHDPVFASAARHLLVEDDNSDVFFWTLEQSIIGRLLQEWDQGQIGDCVGNGGARTQQNTLLCAIAARQESDDGTPTQWPGTEACVEVAYGLSRECAGIHGGGDGSTGAGMAQASVDYGVTIRGVYGSYDLTTYSVRTAQQFGNSVPSELKAVAKQHPVKTVAVVQSGADVWAALGAWKPVAICGNISRTMKRQPGGFCPKTGNDWPHCQALIGRCTVRSSASTWPYHGAGEQAVVPRGRCSRTSPKSPRVGRKA